MSNPFVIPLGIAFIAGTVAMFVSLVRRIANYSADRRKAVEGGQVSPQEWRRNAVLYITCGTIVFLSLLNLSITYVKAFRYHLERSGERYEQVLGEACPEEAGVESGDLVDALPLAYRDGPTCAPTASSGTSGEPRSALTVRL